MALQLVLLQILPQVIVQPVLALELAIVDELQHPATLRQVVRQVNTLQDVRLVEALERNHHLQPAEAEAVAERVRLPREVRHALALDLQLLEGGLPLLFSDSVALEVVGHLLRIEGFALGVEVADVVALGLAVVGRCALEGPALDSLDLRLLLLRNDEQIGELLEELVLALLAEAVLQVLVKHLHYLHYYVFLVLVNLRWLRLLAS